MNTKGKRRESYIRDRWRERKIPRVRERAEREKDRVTHTYAHTRIRDLSSSRPPLIRVKIDFFPLP